MRELIDNVLSWGCSQGKADALLIITDKLTSWRKVFFLHTDLVINKF